MVDDGIVIAGGGFAGFWAALLAAAEIDRIGQDIELTLVSRDDHLTLRPRLYEAAPERFRTPLRPIFNAIDIRFVHGSVDDIDSVGRGVVLAGYAGVLPYGRLMLATGCVRWYRHPYRASSIPSMSTPGTARCVWSAIWRASVRALARRDAVFSMPVKPAPSAGELD